VPLARYTESWRQARKVLDRSLRPSAIAAYRSAQQMKAHTLLSRMLENPDEWEAHLEQFVESLLTPLCLIKHLSNRPACQESSS
jgi:cytochrome P450